jgi:hypothetical protein
VKAFAAVFLIAFFIVLVIFGIGSWSCNQPPEPSSETQQTEQTNRKNCTTINETLATGLLNIGEFIHGYHQETVAIATVVIAIFTIILGLFTVNLAQSTRIAAKHIPRVERAYLFLWKELKHKITPNPLGGDILEVQFAFHNHGKTPAILRRIEVDVRIIERYPKALREIAEDMPMGFALSSEETTPFFRADNLSSQNTGQTLNRGSAFCCFSGWSNTTTFSAIRTKPAFASNGMLSAARAVSAHPQPIH